MNEGASRWTCLLDLGAVGWREKHSFSVLLCAKRLKRLVEAAELGSRMHELLTMHRVGDLWHYIDVQAIDLPPRVQRRWSEATKFQRDTDKRLPFEKFDRWFVWMGDDTEPEDEAWRDQWSGPAVGKFLAELWEQVRDATAHRLPSDEVAVYERQLIAEGRHGYETWPRSTVIEQTRWLTPAVEPQLPMAFCAALDTMLRRPELDSVRYRGQGDHHLLRMMCNEQRRRANAQGCPAVKALELSALCEVRIDNRAWSSQLRHYDEGLGWGDLHIETPNDYGAPLQELLGTPFQRFGRWVFSLTDLGELKGYRREYGNDWTLYEALPETVLPRRPAFQFRSRGIE